MGKRVSVIIPIGPRHQTIARRAIESVKRQTVKTEILPILDNDGRGPSWARNRGIEQATGDYVVFLDADDQLSKDFVESTLKVIRPGHYVYTDFYKEDETVIRAPADAWCFNGKVHIVTVLAPTNTVRKIGGFDEGLIHGGEDGEFFFRLRYAGCCGIHLPKPLVWYHDGGSGKRSFAWITKYKDEKEKLFELNKLRYGGNMSCCGGGKPNEAHTQIDRHTKPNTFVFDRGDQKITMHIDTLARAKWSGNRSMVGRSTGYTYPRASRPKTMYIDNRDARSMPNAWEILPIPDKTTPASLSPLEAKPRRAKTTNLLDIAREQGMFPKKVEAAPVPPADTAPDIKRVIELAKRGMEE
jgi:hypothetical protein